MSQVVGQAAQLVSILAVAAAGIGSAVWFSLPAVINAVVGLVWIYATARRVVRVRLAVDLPTWWAWLKEAAPLSLGFALETAYFRIDVLMLSVMSATLTPVGMYGVGYRFSDLVGSLPVALLAPALALMVDAWERDRQRFHQTFRTSLIILFLVGVGVGIGFAVFAEEAITLLYGDRYAPAAGAARLLVIGQVLHFFTSLSFTTLVAVGRNRLYPVAALVGVLINVGLNLLLIPDHSYRGSAFATIITEVSVLAILFVGVSRIPDVRPLPWRGLLRISLAGAILAAALAWFRPLLPWPALAVVAGSGYLLLLHVFAIVGPGGLRALARDARLEMQGRPIGADDDAGDTDDDASRQSPPTVSGGSDDGPGAVRPILRLTAISPHSIVSGAEIVLLRALHAAKDSGWVVRCACPEGPLAERLRSEGIQRDDMPDLRLPSAPRLIGAITVGLRTVRAAVRIRRVSKGSDVVLVNSLHALVALRLARVKAPTAWLVHDVVVRRDRRAFLRLGLPSVDLAIAVSDAAARSLPDGVVRTIVVRNGTPWPVDPARQRVSPPRVVGCSAVLTPWKGQDVLLDAVAILGRDDVVVELIGGTLPKDGDYAERLRARAARPDLRGRVRFLGHVDDPLDVMRDWTIAVCPSVDPEAVSLAVLEAMSIGLPVVGTDHGGIPEFLGSAGLLVEPGDPEQLARSIARLIDDDDLRARCSAAGREAVASSLTVADQQRDLLEALTDLSFDMPGTRPGSIVFAVPDYEPTLGGTTRQTGNEARAMLRSGHAVTVLTQRLDPTWPGTEISEGLRVRRLRPSGRGKAAMKGFVLSTAVWLRRHRDEIEVVHVVMYPDLAIAAVLAGLGDRTVMSWAGYGDATDSVTPSEGALRRALGRGRRRMLAPVAHVALTPAIADELGRIGLGRDVTVIPTPVDTGVFRPPTGDGRAAAREALHLADDELAVVFTGHLRALKRVDALVEAFALLVADDRSARLLLVGGGRSDLDYRGDALRQQVRDLGIEDSVTFVGEVGSVMPYLHAADVFVMPSDREGLPNSILEAMACGLPVVAPPSAAGDQVLDATTGIVPDSNDSALLYEALATLADDPALRRSLGHAAREATAAYDLQRVTAMLERLHTRLGTPDPQTARPEGRLS